VEFVATIPSNVKFMNGRLKHVLKNAMADMVPPAIVNRTDKMGFPVPLHEWLNQSRIVQEFVRDVFSSRRALSRDLIDNAKVVEGLTNESRYGRKIWGLLSLELWQQAFHDRASSFRQLANVEVLR
jgi:asparagine synthase (glutamine-hydrolysing)